MEEAQPEPPPVDGAPLEHGAEGGVPRQHHVREEHHLVGVVRDRERACPDDGARTRELQRTSPSRCVPAVRRPDLRTLVDVLPVARRRPQLGGALRVEPRVRVVDHAPRIPLAASPLATSAPTHDRAQTKLKNK